MFFKMLSVKLVVKIHLAFLWWDASTFIICFCLMIDLFLEMHACELGPC